jgi:hypothetical protein
MIRLTEFGPLERVSGLHAGAIFNGPLLFLGNITLAGVRCFTRVWLF